MIAVLTKYSISESVLTEDVRRREIKDRGVNSLFDCKESYSGSIILLQERGDIQAQISPLFKVGFLMWRWKVNLVFR